MAEVNERTVSLGEQIRRVAEARKERDRLREDRDRELAKWEAEYAPLLADLAKMSEVVQEVEEALRDLTIKAYNETGSKQPAPGVGIREMTRLEYDPKEALAWATQHQIALSLDKKTFENFAKNNPMEFVKVWQEVQATIATDLSKMVQ